jgi:hypothetical protein
MSYLKVLLLSTIVLISSTSDAESLRKSRIPYHLVSSQADSSLAANCSAYEFTFEGVTEESYTILYSIDGEEGQAKISRDGHLIVNASPGPHIFQFFTWHYSEVFTDSLTILSQNRDVWSIYMASSSFDIEVSKPVIYLYPQVPTDVKVSLDIFGKNPFYYPKYINGWEATAMPNGDLKMNNEVYNYLFWEASAKVDPITHKDGFFVSKSNVVPFLEKHLTTAGLTSKEQADFITYWAPRLAQHDQSFVHFIFNEACDEFASLSITPKPDHIYRIYILWQPTENTFDAPEQIIQPMNREGFSVLEWGGIELPAVTNNEVQ